MRFNPLSHSTGSCDDEDAITLKIRNGNGPLFDVPQIHRRKLCSASNDDAVILRTDTSLLAGVVDRLNLVGGVRKRKARVASRNHVIKPMAQHDEVPKASMDERIRELTTVNARLQAAADGRDGVDQALQHSRKMEVLSPLAGRIAQDLNNLLTSISGSLELMHTRALQGRIEEFDFYIETAMEPVNRAAMLIHRLLAFSRKQTLTPKLININFVVDDMEDRLRRAMGSRIQVDVSFTNELWPVLCDQDQIESVLLDLVTNARDAMPDGGHLGIETSNTVVHDRRGAPRVERLQHVPPGEYVVLSITDNGRGMTRDVIAHAFDPFFTTKPSDQGIGLGLSMTCGFIQQSGGHVCLDSKVGQGTTVEIYLPRHFQAVGEHDVGAACRLGNEKAKAIVRAHA